MRVWVVFFSSLLATTGAETPTDVPTVQPTSPPTALPTVGGGADALQPANEGNGGGTGGGHAYGKNPPGVEPTSAPTAQPTTGGGKGAPVVQPTSAPTAQPTTGGGKGAPGVQPTSAPTAQPTTGGGKGAPGVQPTSAPTAQPTTGGGKGGGGKGTTLQPTTITLAPTTVTSEVTATTFFTTTEPDSCWCSCSCAAPFAVPRADVCQDDAVSEAPTAYPTLFDSGGKGGGDPGPTTLSPEEVSAQQGASKAEDLVGDDPTNVTAEDISSTMEELETDEVVGFVDELATDLAESYYYVEPEVVTSLITGIGDTLPTDRQATSEETKAAAESLLIVIDAFEEDLPEESALEATVVLDDIVLASTTLREPLDDEQLTLYVASAGDLTDLAANSSSGGSASSAAMGKDLARVADSISVIAAFGLEPDAGPRTITSTGLSITVAAVSPDTLAAGASLGGFQLPPMGDMEEGTTMDTSSWSSNPFALSDPGEENVTTDGPGCVLSLTLRDENGTAKEVSGLAEPVTFCMDRVEDMSVVTDENGDEVVIDRGCVFWDEALETWGGEGCEVDEENSNYAQVCCKCTHLTSFTASAKKALCKFCNIEVSYLWDTSKWLDFDWSATGIYVLFLFLACLYAPCFLLCYKDYNDWKPLATNQKAYFKDQLPSQETFTVMLLPPFRVCFGFIMCAPTMVTCPPRCCRKRKPKGEEAQEAPKVKPKPTAESQLYLALHTMRRMKQGHHSGARPHATAQKDPWAFMTKHLVCPHEIQANEPVVLKSVYAVHHKDHKQSKEGASQHGTTMGQSLLRIRDLMTDHAKEDIVRTKSDLSRTKSSASSIPSQFPSNAKLTASLSEDAARLLGKGSEPQFEAPAASQAVAVPAAQDVEAGLSADTNGAAAPQTQPPVASEVATVEEYVQSDAGQAPISAEGLVCCFVSQHDGAVAIGDGGARRGPQPQVRTQSNSSPVSVPGGQEQCPPPLDRTQAIISALPAAAGDNDGLMSKNPNYMHPELASRAIAKIQGLVRKFMARRRVARKRLANQGLGLLEAQVTIILPPDQQGQSHIVGPCEVFLRTSQQQMPNTTPRGKRASVVVQKRVKIHVSFDWSFSAVPCANLPEKQLFGSLQIWAPSLVLERRDLPELLGKEVTVSFSVRTGIDLWQRWDQKMPISQNEGAPCALSVGSMAIRNFRKTPWVCLEILKGHTINVQVTDVSNTSLVQESGVEAMAFLSLPETNATESVQCVLLDASGKMETGETAVVDYDWRIQSGADDIETFSCVFRATSVRLSRGDDGNTPMRFVVITDAPTNNAPALVSTLKVSKGRTKSLAFQYKHSHAVYTALGRIMSNTPDAPALALAKKMQYVSWNPTWLCYKVANRETPLKKCCAYNALISRKQRYGVLSTAILFGAMMSVIFFRAECSHAPKPANCKPKPSLLEQMMSWDVIFASIWAVIITTPVPLILITCFKKRVILAQTSQARKDQTLRLWRIRENCGWCFAISLQIFSIFVISQYIRYYSWGIVQKYFYSQFMGLVHRFISAPGIRVLWMVTVLLISHICGLCDLCLLTQPQITAFTEPVPAPPAPGVVHKQKRAVTESTDTVVFRTACGISQRRPDKKPTHKEDEKDKAQADGEAANEAAQEACDFGGGGD